MRIERGGSGCYRVHASTRVAEASTEFELPFSDSELENFSLKVSRPWGASRINSSAIADARLFGASLFEALFRDEVGVLYRTTLLEARGRECGVRVTLCLSGSPELIDVPWEYLFDDPDFLAMSVFTPVVRYLDLPREHRPLMVEPPLRLLGIVSSPHGLEPLDVARERANLEGAVAGLVESGAVELHWLERPTLTALHHELETQTVHALHYVGHGVYDRQADQGVLMFEDDDGWPDHVDADELGAVLHDFTSLRLAVVNACEAGRSAHRDRITGVAGALIRRDIPAVVAMQFEISDQAAIAFAGGFYKRLAAGLPVDASVAAARLAMLAGRSGDIEWGTPVLFMRFSDGRLFDFSDRSGPREDGAQYVAVNRVRDAEGADPVGGRLQSAAGDPTSEYVARGVGRLSATPPVDRRIGAPPAPVRHLSGADELGQRLSAQRSGDAHLIFRNGEGRQVICELLAIGGLVTIGRLNHRDISLAWDEETSRLHAKLELTGEDWTIVDSGSRNGTFVNNERLAGPRRLRDGDSIVIGRTAIVFRSPHRADGYTTRQSADNRLAFDLSESESRVLAALCRPCMTGSEPPATNAAIADELGMEVSAVDQMLATLLARFGLDRLPQSDKRMRLAAAALHNGVVPIGEQVQRR